jgi:hypothetical protein
VASNSITFKVKVEKDGSLKVVAKEAKSATKATDDLGKSTDTLTKKRDKFNKVEKGVGQTGLSSGKALSKMKQAIGGGSSGLVGAYAVLAANIFALTAAFGALQRAAQVKQLEAGLGAMGTASGTALKTLSNGLREATGHALNMEDAMRATALATSAGFDSSSIERLGDVARKASIALGRDTADSLNRLTKGAIKLEPELLDELGIMVRLDDATETYARGLGKTANQLTLFEKRQAFMNAVLEEGEAKFAAMAGVETNPYDRLAATFNDLTKALLNILNNVLIPIVGVFANSQAAMLGGMVMFARTIATSMVPALADLSGGYAESRQKAKESSEAQVKNLKNLTGGSKAVKDLQGAIASGTATQKDFDKALNGAQLSLQVNQEHLKNLTNESGDYSDAIERKNGMVRESQVALDATAESFYQHGKAALADGDAMAVNAAASGDFKGALSQLSEQFDGYNQNAEKAKKGTSGLTKAKITLGNAATKAALGVRVLGTAFLTAIPIIGQIIAAVGIAWSLFKKLMEMMKSDEQKEYEKKTKAASEAMKEYADSIDQVNNFMSGQESTITSVGQKYLALGNIIRGVQEHLKDLKPGEGTGWRMFSANVQPFREGLIEIMRASGKTKEELQAMAKEAGFSAKQVARLGNKDLNNMLETTAFNLGTFFAEELKKSVGPLEGLVIGFNDAKEAIDKFVSTNKLKTSVDDIITQFDNLNLTFEAASKPGQNQEDRLAILDAMPASLKKIIGYEKLRKQLTSGEIKDGDAFIKKLKAQSTIQNNALKGIQDEERLSKGKIAKAKSELQLLKNKNLEGDKWKEVLEQEKILQQEAVNSLENKLSKFKIANAANLEEAHIKEHIKNLEDEITNVKAHNTFINDELLKQEKEKLTLAENSLSVTQAAGAAEQKILDLIKSQRDAKETIAMNQIKGENRADHRRSGPVTAAQEYKSKFGGDEGEENTLQARIDIITKEFDIKKKIAQAEMKVLKARLDVLAREQAKAKGVSYEDYKKKDEDGLFKAIETLTKTEVDIAAAIDAQRDAAISSLREEASALLAKVKQEYLNPQGKDPQENVLIRQDAGAVLGKAQTEGTEDDTTTGQKGTKDQAKVSLKERFAEATAAMSPMMEQLKQLGPEGELIAAATEGALTVGSAWTGVAETFSNTKDKMQRTQAVLGAIGATLQAVQGIMNAQTNARVAAIDKEIEAEKRRDGKSKESIAKIKQMEAKKEAIKKKAFEQNKKIQMAMVVVNTAMAISSALAGAAASAAGTGPMAWATLPTFTKVMVGMMAVMGAAQLAIIAGTSYQGGGGSAGGGASVPSSISVGQRRDSVDISKSQNAGGELAYFRGAQGIGGPENFRKAFYGSRHRAAGGNMGYIVGEQGPELFMPDRPGTIVPADDTAAMTGGGGVVNFNINTIDATGVESVLEEQQGNIIGMLRQAANSYGEEFMEDIDESIYTSPVVSDGVSRR